MPQHILYIEDSVNDQRFVRKVLESHGYALTVATNGEQGLDIARDKGPDLILVDIQMPGLDGMETARLLRLIPRCARTPIVALTAYAEKFERQAYLNVGFTDYQQKQAGIKPLLALVERYLMAAESPSAPASAPPAESAVPAEQPADAVMPSAAEKPEGSDTSAQTPEVPETANVIPAETPNTPPPPDPEVSS